MSNETTTPWNHTTGNLSEASGIDIPTLEGKHNEVMEKIFFTYDESKDGSTGLMSEAAEIYENSFSKRELSILVANLTQNKIETAQNPFASFLKSISNS